MYLYNNKKPHIIIHTVLHNYTPPPHMTLIMNPKDTWREYTAPNGAKYYYNTETKQTTWVKPVDSSPKSEPVRLVFVVPLVNGWNLVICSNGKKFYYCTNTTCSSLLPDDESRQLLDKVDRQKLVSLIGIARGYPVNSGLASKLYDSVLSDIELAKLGRDGSESSDVSKEGENVGKEENYSNNQYEELVSPEEEEEQNEVVQQVPLLPTDSIKLRMFALFDKFDLNKYSTWRLELSKVNNDPDFYLVSDDNTREALFEEWCGHQDNSVETEDLKEPEEDTDTDSNTDTDSDTDNLEPTKFHYLAHILSKATIKDDTIFQDIYKQNKRAFKQYKIDDFISSKREQESFVSKLLFYYKRFSLSEREHLLRKSLEGKCRDSILNTLTVSDKIRGNLTQLLKENLSSDDADAYTIETLLLKMENLLKDCGCGSLLEDSEYYIVGIKDKTIVLLEFLKSVLV